MKLITQNGIRWDMNGMSCRVLQVLAAQPRKEYDDDKARAGVDSKKDTKQTAPVADNPTR